ncbi:MAG: YdcF family protein [Rhodospirillales bacterium]|nr:YdcF family protein [Rhodospirillales bacterium]
MRRSDANNKAVFANLLLAGFALLGLWAIGLVKFDEAIPLTIADTESRVQAIIVLTGGSGRLDAGLDLLARDPRARLFVSGVYKGNEVRHLLKLSSQRPPALGARIGIGNAIDTRENAAETAVWVVEHNIRSLRLVTAAYHMPRSLLEFEHKLPDVKIIAHPVFPEHVKQERWWAYPGTAALVVSEYNKFLLAWVRQQFEGWSGLWAIASTVPE